MIYGKKIGQNIKTVEQELLVLLLLSQEQDW
jgi:hypothetical protein